MGHAVWKRGRREGVVHEEGCCGEGGCGVRVWRESVEGGCEDGM